jgi:Uma2 family endonuclease
LALCCGIQQFTIGKPEVREAAMSVPVLRRRFTVDEYYRMAEAGILHEDDRVELIEGEIVEMAPIGSRHAACIKRLIGLFSRQVGQDVATLDVQDPIHLGEHSEPQPDITLLRPRSDSYAVAHPVPEDILLLIEVADTSGEYDRGIKVPLYAQAGIREYWIVGLADEIVEVYRDPSPEGYRQIRQLRHGERITPEGFPDVEIAIDDVLLPR